ncbi:right-handed parallel beta-helix repeat-containing protein, partial [bacterium]|nr:right-handed parallel beta-helix repeat-containing protein [bacterium]
MKKFLIFLVFFFSSIWGEVYYVSPSGSNYNDGETPKTAWKTPDRGQPTYLRKNANEGDKILYVARAVQFPEKGKVLVGKNIVEYNGRTADKLLNCKGVKKARKGTKVISADWKYLKPGDKVIIEEGVYTLKENFSKDNKEWAGGINSVFAITSSGKEKQPIIIEGKGKVIIDGEWNKKSLFIKGNYIKIKNLFIRRGGIFVVFSRDITLENNRIYYGIGSIFVRYSSDINIKRNLIYDFHGAWTSPGISIGDSKNVNIIGNTVVNCGRGIHIWGKTEGVNIKENIVAWCRTGLIKDEKVKISPENIHKNLFWANGKVIWLHLLGKPGRKEGTNHYKGIEFSPEDIHQDPEIVSWYSWTDEFLSPSRNSVCFTNKMNIGAKKGNDFPHYIKYKKGENILFNPSFEFGFNGWKGSSWWSFNEGEGGWEIKERDAIHGKKYLHLYENPPKGKRNAPVVVSTFFPVNRGTTYTISFYARGKGSIGVGFTYPSWHGGSATGKTISLTPEWKRYTVKIKLPGYLPDWVGVRFSSNCSFADIDAVKVEEGENPTDFSPEIEIFYQTNEYGILKPDGYIPLVINNYSKKRDLVLLWKLFDPYGNIIDEGKIVLNPRKRFKKLRLKEKIEGIYLFSYRVVDKKNKLLGSNNFRILFGERIKKIKNRDFIGATPPYKHYSSLEEFEKITKKLSSYGIGTFHLYAGIERMKEFIEESTFEKYVEISRKYGINWILTLSDAKLFTGKMAFAPAPGNTEEDFKRIEKLVLNQGKITENQLIVWKNYIEKLVKKFKGKIKYYEILNEPNC